MRVFIADDEQGIVELIKHLITVENVRSSARQITDWMRCTNQGTAAGYRDHRYYDAADERYRSDPGGVKDTSPDAVRGDQRIQRI